MCFVLDRGQYAAMEKPATCQAAIGENVSEADLPAGTDKNSVVILNAESGVATHLA